MDSDKLYKIAVSKIPGVGPVTAKKLIAYVGNLKDIFELPPQKLKQIPGVGNILSKQIANSEILHEAERELKFIEKYNIQLIFYTDSTYPARLKFCEDSPLCIYKKGNLPLEHSKAISIIGTRQASVYGKNFCEKLVADLKEEGYSPVIVSGLAYGIDICAHKAALNQNLPTIAVLAHGFSTLYPAAHRKHAEKIIEEGALITEFTSDIGIFRNNFISRNRIVAGMTEATIVIESAEKGGALVTAEMAAGYSRDVFALPGRLTDTYSAGCNKLIANNKAQLLTSAKDIVEALNWDIPKKQAIQKKLFIDLSPDEELLLSALDSEGISIDSIAHGTQLPMKQISSLLLKLEFDGVVKSLPGKKFARL